MSPSVTIIEGMKKQKENIEEEKIILERLPENFQQFHLCEFFRQRV